MRVTVTNSAEVANGQERLAPITTLAALDWKIHLYTSMNLLIMQTFPRNSVHSTPRFAILTSLSP